MPRLRLVTTSPTSRKQALESSKKEELAEEYAREAAEERYWKVLAAELEKVRDKALPQAEIAAQEAYEEAFADYITTAEQVAMNDIKGTAHARARETYERVLRERLRRKT